MNRKLSITLQPDWRAAIREAGRKAVAGAKQHRYMGETLSFATPALFFSRLTEKRWEIIDAMQGAGTLGVRELARRVKRDVKRVHEDAAVLVDMGILEKDEKGALTCPFADIHVDFRLHRPLPKAQKAPVLAPARPLAVGYAMA